jgi:ribosome-binding factor A
MKFTPQLEFAIDPGVLGGERIETILRSLQQDGDGAE